MKIAIITLSKKGYELACKITPSPLAGEGWGEGEAHADIYVPAKIHPPLNPLPSREGGVLTYSYPLSNLITKIFNQYDAFVFIMAMGIVVRQIAPFLKNKSYDPAVITIDEAAHFCISTLGGHEAGANKLTKKIADCLDAQPVITTASQNSKIVLGIGLRKNKPKEEIKEAILSALAKKNMELEDIDEILTIEIKKDDEALKTACKELNTPLRFVTKEEINNLEADFASSDFVMNSIGVEGVCEPAALIGSENKQLIMKKTTYDGITIALAR